MMTASTYLRLKIPSAVPITIHGINSSKEHYVLYVLNFSYIPIKCFFFDVDFFQPRFSPINTPGQQQPPPLAAKPTKRPSNDKKIDHLNAFKSKRNSCTGNNKKVHRGSKHKRPSQKGNNNGNHIKILVLQP